MKVMVVGAGRTGRAVARQLAEGGDYRVALVDCTERAVDAAARLGCHYLDLAETAGAMNAVRRLADGARGAFIPGCGVSPGLVSNIAASLAGVLEPPVDLTVRVGSLPAHPSNRLGYTLTWDLNGLFEEYTSPCDALVGGRPALLEPLGRYERFVLDGTPYEAFTTAGGVGDLCKVLAGRVRGLTFKTIRYPGHLDGMRFLLEDLGLAERRDLLFTLLRNGLPETDQDVVVFFITVRGRRDGVAAEETYVRRVPAVRLPDGSRIGALHRLSAAHVAAVLDLLRDGTIAGRGPVRHEDIPAPLLLGNRFLRPLIGDA
ncbi:saccharopine dehydrogenase family protein [Azospirillum halopraeferens]|uniref:saccharopine dehydrogenase family protein n=1 Tax=Azospirillum halopraeferens TaxID=34010 RepID=UPI00041B317E|nr:saccharopine dehydrogenase C-terminal domain-containing protein [Azospirillum halopraeferens]